MTSDVKQLMAMVDEFADFSNNYGSKDNSKREALEAELTKLVTPIDSPDLFEIWIKEFSASTNQSFPDWEEYQKRYRYFTSLR